MNLIFPCALISIVAVFGFLLPPASGEKVNLELTVLLSLAVFQLIVLEMMPPIGDAVPFIGNFLHIFLLCLSVCLSVCLPVLAICMIYIVIYELKIGGRNPSKSCAESRFDVTAN